MSENKFQFIKTPHLGVNEDYARVVNWFFNDGDYVEKEAIICELETTKASFEVNSPFSGYFFKCVKLDNEVQINDNIAFIASSKDIGENKLKEFTDIETKYETKINSNKFTKKALNLIKKLNLNIEEFNIEKEIVTEKDILTAYESTLKKNIEINIKGNKKSILIYGAGKGGETIIDNINLSNQFTVEGFIDDNPTSNEFRGLRVFENKDLKLLFDKGIKNIIISISNGKIRKKIFSKCREIGFNIPSIIHPKAFISEKASIGEGCHIKAGAIIDTNSVVENGCIIDNGSIIPHDNTIKEFAHIAPGVSLGSSITVGEFSIIGIGSSVSTGVKIGSNCIVSVGSSVEKDLNDNEIVQGVPSRLIGERK